MSQRTHTVLFNTGDNQSYSPAPNPTSAGRFARKMLTPRDHRVLQLIALGYRHKEIAEHLGISPTTVGAVANSPIGRHHLELLMAVRENKTRNIRLELQEKVAPAAFDKLCSLVLEGDHDNPCLTPKDAAREYREILALAGYVKPQKLEVSGAVAHLTSEDFEEIRRRATLAAEECGLQLSLAAPRSADEIIDAPFSELFGEEENERQTSTNGNRASSVPEYEDRQSSSPSAVAAEHRRDRDADC